MIRKAIPVKTRDALLNEYDHRCAVCGGNEIRKAGESACGGRRYCCQNQIYSTKTFMLEDRYKAYIPGTKEKIVEMSINGGGIRDTARVLSINRNTVISTLKKSGQCRPGES